MRSRMKEKAAWSSTSARCCHFVAFACAMGPQWHGNVIIYGLWR